MTDKPPTYHVTINATPEQVWPLVGDLGRQGEWSPKPYKVEWLSGEANAVGSTFRSTGWLPQDKEHSMEGTVKVNEPMKTFEVVSHDDKEEWTNRYELASSGSQTTVTKTMTGPPLSGVKKAARSAIFALFVNGAVQKGLDMLKAKVESGSAAA
ncbi:MAG: SRPBCC family protein [Actinomycetota bacterium]